LKWLGKDELIDSLQSDVYLESIATSSGVNVLVVDSDNKIGIGTATSARTIQYATYTWTFATEGGAISTINLPAATALPTTAVIDAENSYIVTQVPLSGNAGATVEIGINHGGGPVSLFIGADTDFFMAPTAYNAAPFSGYGGVAKGLANVCRIASTTQITWKIATAELTGGYVEIYVAYKTL